MLRISYHSFFETIGIVSTVLYSFMLLYTMYYGIKYSNTIYKISFFLKRKRRVTYRIKRELFKSEVDYYLQPTLYGKLFRDKKYAGGYAIISGKSIHSVETVEVYDLSGKKIECAT